MPRITHTELLPMSMSRWGDSSPSPESAAPSEPDAPCEKPSCPQSSMSHHHTPSRRAAPAAAPSPANARGAGPRRRRGGGLGRRWAPSRGSPARPARRPRRPRLRAEPEGRRERGAAGRTPRTPWRTRRFRACSRTQAALERGMALPAVLARVAVLPHAFPFPGQEGAGGAAPAPPALAATCSQPTADLLPPYSRSSRRVVRSTGGGTRRCTRRRQQARGCPCSWPPRRSRRCPARRR